MKDHSIVNSLPEAQSRFSFLLKGMPPVPLSGEMQVEFLRCQNPKEVLEVLLNKIESVGLHACYVDQTLPELHSIGIKCVKAIIPGLLPMTFGYVNRRLRLPRLKQIDSSLLNPHPHPFP